MVEENWVKKFEFLAKNIARWKTEFRRKTNFFFSFFLWRNSYVGQWELIQRNAIIFFLNYSGWEKFRVFLSEILHFLFYLLYMFDCSSSSSWFFLMLSLGRPQISIPRRAKVSILFELRDLENPLLQRKLSSKFRHNSPLNGEISSFRLKRCWIWSDYYHSQIRILSRWWSVI